MCNNIPTAEAERAAQDRALKAAEARKNRPWNRPRPGARRVPSPEERRRNPTGTPSATSRLYHQGAANAERAEAETRQRALQLGTPQDATRRRIQFGPTERNMSDNGNVTAGERAEQRNDPGVQRLATSNTEITAPAQDGPVVVAETPDFSNLNISPALTAALTQVVTTVSRNTHATVENLRHVQRAENDQRYSMRSEVEKRFSDLEQSVHHRLDVLSNDISLMREERTRAFEGRGSAQRVTNAPQWITDGDDEVDDGDYESRAGDEYRRSRGRRPYGYDDESPEPWSRRRAQPSAVNRRVRSNHSSTSRMRRGHQALNAHTGGNSMASRPQPSFATPRLGPPVSYAEEVPAADPRFAHLKSYRRYRLNNRA